MFAMGQIADLDYSLIAALEKSLTVAEEDVQQSM